ncbi:AAA family ATPase [Thermocrinis minervae]|uniref:Gluconokinase n=1 Tax=Thermocrinis minervae TaxID=381751 RepID=A0A1M6QCY4_9AQUI|nr:AAA family ATPase [Thermocrinis minervae]SHK17980.1 gluconokinase/hypothetical protein [Thermocrinis minervae]
MKRLVITVGLSGSGKSYISSLLKDHFGYEWIRSDLIRKELAGLDPKQKVKEGYLQGIYSEEFTRRVYEEMLRRTEKLLKEGKKVVVDATFLKDWQRKMFLEKFPDLVMLWVVADEEEIKRRLKNRVDISDADWEVYLKQKESFEEPEGAIKIHTQKSKEELIQELKLVLS